MNSPTQLPPQVAQQLSQLRDLHTPDAIGFWPLAPGWWILIVLALFIFASAWMILSRYFKRNAWRRDVIKEFKLAEKDYSSGSNSENHAKLSALFKRSIASVVGHHRLVALPQEFWITQATSAPFLLPKDQADALFNSHYQKEPIHLQPETLKALLHGFRKLNQSHIYLRDFNDHRPRDVDASLARANHKEVAK